MAATMTRSMLRTYWLRALADGDMSTAQYYFQRIQQYDETKALYGKAAADAALPKIRVRRAGGRLALMRQYDAALKAGNTKKAERLAKRIALRDRSGMTDDVGTDRTGLPLMDTRGAAMGDVPDAFFKAKDLPKAVLDEYRALLAGLRR